ncbi:hypothetical protein B0H13DRAFT_2330808 [Mycena leptocephala]|nr:hypothetical protein B0H13DRAFT_2330808 [Mycena leptocephala]
MSQTPVFSTASPNLYRYIVIGTLSVVIIIGVMLFWRSRIIERQLLNRPIQTLATGLENKPRLYDAYLDGHGESWPGIMPLSIHRVAHLKQNSAKHASLVDPLVSALSTVAVMIAMPSSNPPERVISTPGTVSSQESDSENGKVLPYLEFGVMDVEILGGISESEH